MTNSINIFLKFYFFLLFGEKTVSISKSNLNLCGIILKL